MDTTKKVLINYNSTKIIQNSLRNGLNLSKKVSQVDFALQLTNIGMTMINELNEGIFFAIPARKDNYKLVTNGADLWIEYPNNPGMVNDSFSVLAFMIDTALKILDTDTSVMTVLRQYQI
ncbi:hypothetical protein [Latilactobacillus sakei]|uniref:hypothetical protein n=1 Tax=Latilactobacillus sakei TaxID=1599 RepID=UPI00202FC667|nr:hypothetical protein [Latilactobacillus sakei]MCM1636283.1 hypothetical protein [Latilactobacillus sakei]